MQFSSLPLAPLAEPPFSVDIMVFSPRTSIISLTLLASTLMASCGDPISMTSSRDHHPSVVANLQSAKPINAGPSTFPGHTLRDEYTAMAQRIPGGLGGLYFDSEGILTVVLSDPARADEARVALEDEALIQTRGRMPGGDQFNVSLARIKEGRYSHSELHDWLDTLLAELARANLRSTMSGISVRENAILLGVPNGNQRDAAGAIAEALEIPEDALLVDIVPPLRKLSSVHDRMRPVLGGLQIEWGGNGRCTVGPNMLRSPVGYDPEPGYLVASHCSDYPFVSFYEEPDPITHYFQAENDGSKTNHIGNKGVDPPLFSCAEDPNGCRNSDAAQALYPTDASGDFGYIARPASRNDDTYALDTNQPRFEIVSTFPWTISGETIEKVGRATGWSGGQVVEGCLTWDADGYSIRCAMTVDARAGSTDSGAPAFMIVTGTQVELRGLVLGGLGGCVLGLDPVYAENIWYCNQFVASNLGGIIQDLDPNGNAPLSFY